MKMPYSKFLTFQPFNIPPLSFTYMMLSTKSQHHEASSLSIPMKEISIYFVYKKGFLQTSATLQFLTLGGKKEGLLWA
jgi:hypothetical protein